jgi:hypothetical protein
MTWVQTKEEKNKKKMQFSFVGLIFTISILDLAKLSSFSRTQYGEEVEILYLHTLRNSEQEL